MKNRSLILVLLILVAKTGWSQNTYLDYKRAIKISNLTTFEEHSTSRISSTDSTNRYRTTQTNLQILHPTIAIQWRTKKNNFHEVELTHFTIGKVGTATEVMNDTTNNSQLISGQDVTTSAISVRYEYILNFNKSKDHKLVPSIGFGISPYYFQTNYSPRTASAFPNAEKRIGMRSYITPRLTYFFTSKLFLDLNVPLCLFDNYIFVDEEADPSIPSDQRTISTFNFNQFPKIFSGRIGIGLKL